MDFTASVLFLVLMGTACGAPHGSAPDGGDPVCQTDCEIANTHYDVLPFEHLEQKQALAAPWTLIYDVKEGREPEMIPHAKCENCTLQDMISVPIHLRIYVYQRCQDNVMYKCPYDLAVGCTCQKTVTLTTGH